MRLDKSFYSRPTLEVAEELLGKYIVYKANRKKLSARIVEVEAYIGQNDPACHAARGKTERNAVMFGPAGFAYIYFIYGMYYCLNFVTEPENQAAAILLRAAEPVDGLDIMLANSPESAADKPNRVLAGPGKFCRAFGLTKKENGVDLSNSTLYLESRSEQPVTIARDSRIGIKTGTDKLWRFYDKNSGAVSVLTKKLEK